MTEQDRILANNIDSINGLSKKDLKDLADRCGVKLLPNRSAEHIRTVLRNIHGHTVIAAAARDAGINRSN